MTWRTATWALAAMALVGFLVYLSRGDVHCGDLPGGCPEDTWTLMDAWARRGLVLALLASTMAAVTLLHPEHRGRRLGLVLLTVGLAGWSAVNVLADNGDLPEPPAATCDDSPGSGDDVEASDGADRSAKCGPSWDPHWTDLFAVPTFLALGGLGILVGKALRDLVAGRRPLG